jgi:diguanylate cyclase (GGDEF)-like protein
MLNNAILVGKLNEICKKSRPSADSLASCCQEILKNFGFDCVFIAHAPSPEEPPVPMAVEGKEEVMDTCLYRLGVEERVALSKLPLKTYSDITGKPVFSKAGTLRIQKPNSGLFMAYYRPKQDFVLLGCAHQDSRSYDQNLLTELTNMWKPWQESLLAAVRKVLESSGGSAPQNSPPQQVKVADEPHPSGPLPETTGKPSASMATAPRDPDKNHRRPVILVDEATRLFNKDYFEECLAIEVERAKRYSRELSLIFLSVTPVDSHGNGTAEEEVAPQVADVLFKSLRRVDIICRLEKNKYGIILPDTANNTYGIIAKRIFKFFKQVLGDAPPVFLNISASTYPKHAGSHLLLFENAEKLLSQAKEVGPNKAVLPE